MRNFSFLCLIFLSTNLFCSDLDQKLARLAGTSVSFGNRDQVGAELKACTSSVMEGFVSQKGSEILSQISGANLSGLEVAGKLRQLGSEYETSLCEQLRFKDAADFHRQFDAEIPLMTECLVERADVAGSSTDVFRFTQEEAQQAIGECGGLPLFFRLMGHSEKLAQRLEGQEADSQNIQAHVTGSLEDYRESLGMLREFAGTRLLDNAAPVAQCIAGRVPDIKEQRVQQVLADKKAQEAAEFVDSLKSVEEDGSLDRRVAATFLVACRAQGQSNQDCDNVTFEGSNMTMSRITDGVDSTLFTHIDISQNKVNANSDIEHELGATFRVARDLEMVKPGEHQLDSNTSCVILELDSDRLSCMTDISNNELSSMRQKLDSSVAARKALFDNPPKTTRELFEHHMLFSGFPHF